MIDPKDFFGQPLAVGDKVVAVRPRYHDLANMKIVKFTPKGCKLEYLRHDIGRNDEYFCTTDQVIKRPQ
jgi:hypothetical protein